GRWVGRGPLGRIPAPPAPAGAPVVALPVVRLGLDGLRVGGRAGVEPSGGPGDEPGARRGTGQPGPGRRVLLGGTRGGGERLVRRQVVPELLVADTAERFRRPQLLIEVGALAEAHAAARLGRRPGLAGPAPGRTELRVGGGRVTGHRVIRPRVP